MSMKWKILIPMAGIMIVLIVTTIVYTSLKFTEFAGLLFSARIKVTATALKKHLADCERDSRIAVISASSDNDIITAVEKHSREDILKLLTGSIDLYHVNFLTVTDENGVVIARTHQPDNFGDSVIQQKNIQEALNGNVSTCIEEGSVAQVAIRAGAPVYNNTGEKIIGVISSGVWLDTNYAVDNLKEHYDADFSIFYENSRIISTIYRDGERITGREPESQMAEALEMVHRSKKEYFANVDVLGENYSAFFLPLLDDNGDIVAIIAAGHSNSELILERNTLQRNRIIIGLLQLIIATIVVLFAIIKIIKPVTCLKNLVSEVTSGNINVSIEKASVHKDEIGILTLDIYSLVDVIKSMIHDLSQLILDLNTDGDINYKIETTKYSGSYKQIIDGIKTLADSVSMMRKTMAVMDYMDTMIIVTDFEYNLLYANNILTDIYRMDRQNYIGKKCYKAIRNLDQPCTSCQLPKLLPNKDAFPVIDYESIYEKKLGLYIGGRAAIIRWVDGAQVFFNASRDETLKMNYQEQLREAATEAEAASVAKSAFLANMSHEIRTPMNSIIGFSELALSGEISPKTRDYLNLIKGNSEWLLQIINDILDISKIESGNMQLEIIPFDLPGLFETCKIIILPRAIEKNLNLRFYSGPLTGKMLLGDPTRLRQVLINLLSNAVKFTDSGGVRLSAAIEGSTESTVTLRFTIKDTGIGMTEDEIQRIYEPFMQGDISTTRKYGGTGLGLAITKKILDLMDSELEIESIPGIGTTINFMLTLATTETTEESDKTGGTVKELKKPTFEGEVLVCEDNRTNQRVIIEHLERVGLKVEIAENGEKGIEKVQKRIDRGEKPFSLIFMDIHMPVMDGIEATGKIIELGTGSPIVAMTANIMSDERERYKTLGMKDYVGKPFTSQELWSCLLKYLKPVSFADIGESEKADDNRLQKQLKTDFVRGNQGTFGEITDALSAGDITLAYRLVHNVKSNAGYIGSTALQKAAAEAEASLRGGENRLTEGQLDDLEAELKAALEELKPYLNETAELPRAAVIYDGEKARELLEKLEPLLRSGNPECLKLVDGLRMIPGSEELIRQIDDFYFRAAEKTLSELKHKLEGLEQAGETLQA